MAANAGYRTPQVIPYFQTGSGVGRQRAYLRGLALAEPAKIAAVKVPLGIRPRSVNS